MNTIQKYYAESLGTFFLVFVGTGAIVADDTYNGIVTHMGIALAFGAVVAILIYSLGHVSGAHFNPAVSFGFWLTKKITTKELGGYIFSQLLGAVLASGLLFFAFPAHQSLGATVPHVPLTFAFILEVIISGLLMFVILSTTSGTFPHPSFTGLAIGTTVGICALFAGGMTGASMNPARSMAPALFSLQLESLWLYLTAPFVGAAGAVLVCSRIHNKEKCCNGDC